MDKNRKLYRDEAVNAQAIPNYGTPLSSSAPGFGLIAATAIFLLGLLTFILVIQWIRMSVGDDNVATDIRIPVIELFGKTSTDEHFYTEQ